MLRVKCIRQNSRVEIHLTTKRQKARSTQIWKERYAWIRLRNAPFMVCKEHRIAKNIGIMYCCEETYIPMNPPTWKDPPLHLVGISSCTPNCSWNLKVKITKEAHTERKIDKMWIKTPSCQVALLSYTESYNNNTRSYWINALLFPESK